MNVSSVVAPCVQPWNLKATPRLLDTLYKKENRAVNEKRIGFRPKLFSPLGNQHVVKLRNQTPTRLAAETTAVETLSKTGPKSHAVEWETAEDLPEDLDGKHPFYVQKDQNGF